MLQKVSRHCEGACCILGQNENEQMSEFQIMNVGMYLAPQDSF